MYIRLAATLSGLITAGEAISKWPRMQYGAFIPDQIVDVHLKRYLEAQQLPKQWFLNPKTKRFSVNGSGIPEVGWDIGESYAGLLSTTDDPDYEQQLFFWFFPAKNQLPQNEILLWLNGGPGCSSLTGLIMEHGPFVCKDGNLKPSPNPWSWNRLTNVVYVEQPVGVGFTTGNVTATDEDSLSEQFIGFWKNFIETFSMQGYKIYITGESYAGVYCSYIANAMLEKNDTTHCDVRGMMLVDALLTDYDVQSAVPAVPFVDYHRSLFHFNDTFRAQIHQLHKDCGYADYLATYLTYPPPHEQPVFSSSDKCTNVFTLIYNESFRMNPCFNYYNIASLCPFPYNPIGISHSLFFTSARGVYFDRADVRRTIHATHGDNNRTWQVCSDGPVFINGTDLSELPARAVLPAVIDATQNVIITHGHLDFSAAANGTLLALQNMTWGGALGFAQAPIEPLVIPRHALAGVDAIQGLADKADLENMQPLGQLGAEGVLGVTHAERGLVYAGVDMAGHLGPADAPSVAFRLVEFLLGRVESLSDGQPFTIEIY